MIVNYPNSSTTSPNPTPRTFQAGGGQGEGNPSAAVPTQPDAKPETNVATMDRTPLTYDEVREEYERRGVGVVAASIMASRQLKVAGLIAGREAEVIDMLCAGTSVKDVARLMEVTPVRMWAWIRANLGPAWKEIQAGQAFIELEVEEAKVKKAHDTMSLSRSSAATKLHQWKLERVAPEEYGTGRSSGSGGVQVNVVIDPSCGGVVKGFQRPAIEVAGD